MRGVCFEDYEIISAGVDWITATQAQASVFDSCVDVGDALLREQRDIGNYIKNWSGFGYEGLKAGGFRMGSSPQGYLLSASGECAHEAWHRILMVATNVSRLDLEVTVRYRTPVTGILDGHVKAMRARTEVRGRLPKLTVIRDSTGGYTMYLGSRSSSWFGRIYDKFTESRDEHFVDCLRYEVEIKGRPAWGVANYLAALGQQFSSDRSICLGWFSDRGVPLGSLSDISQPELSLFFTQVKRNIGDIGQSLQWLENQVRPSVQRLIDAGKRDEVLKALGLD